MKFRFSQQIRILVIALLTLIRDKGLMFLWKVFPFGINHNCAVIRYGFGLRFYALSFFSYFRL